MIVGGLPVWLILAAVVDLLRRRWRWPLPRLVAFSAAALIIELVGLVRVTSAWIRFGFGRTLGSERSLHHHQQLEYWYLRALYGVARKTLGLRIVTDPASPRLEGEAIVIGRHTSYGDAALPGLLAADRPGMRLRYVLARGLQWGPCFDVVGNRLPNHFIDRADADLDAVAELGADLAPDTVVAIFPEGTFHSPARHARRVDQLRRRDPDLAERAAALRHLLPPRPQGTLALLTAAPDADIVILGHIGFESFTSLGAIARSLPFTDPIIVRIWRHDRSTIPADPAGRIDWLYDRWTDLDAWIDERLR